MERWVLGKALILLDYPEEAFHYITAVCTVDLEMPNSVAAERTVARLSMMYAARSQARSSIFVYKYTTPHTLVLNVYENIDRYMKSLSSIVVGGLLSLKSLSLQSCFLSRETAAPSALHNMAGGAAVLLSFLISFISYITLTGLLLSS